jgi:CHASE3 domain sensor protein
MSGSRAKKLRKEYRKIADDVIQSDVKMVVDKAVTEAQRAILYRNLAIIFGSMTLMLSILVVSYAIIL